MKILFYTWGECGSWDFRSALEKYGEVTELCCNIPDKLNDREFDEYLSKRLADESYDFVVSRDFFPIISKVTKRAGIKYIAWSYDGAPMGFYTDAVFNSNNYIFSFDSHDIELLLGMGVKNAFHLPLAVNTDRIDNLLKAQADLSPLYDISFMGTLYQDEENFLDQVANMPDYVRGYLDAVLVSQMNLYGIDLADRLITDDIYEKVSPFVRFNLDPQVFMSEREIFAGFLKKKMTVTERRDILELLSGYFGVTHFAGKGDESLCNVKFGGYLDYMTEMPVVFARSKINLNITLRSIISGIPLRCMDVMGAGGFLLSNYQPELAALFEDGRECAMYTSRQELLEKADYYLQADDERMRIAENAKKKIAAEYTYDILIERMFDVVNSTTR